MKKLLPFALALVLVGQGCVNPFATNEPESSPNDDAMMEGSVEMEGDATTGMTEGDAMMEDGVTTFDVTGRNFAFSPNVIRVKKGEKVRIKFSSAQGFHDWMVDEFNAATIRVNEGDDAVLVEFTPDQAGSFEFYCSVGQHRANGMVGTLIVEEADAMMEGDAMEADVMIDTGVDVEI